MKWSSIIFFIFLCFGWTDPLMSKEVDMVTFCSGPCQSVQLHSRSYNKVNNPGNSRNTNTHSTNKKNVTFWKKKKKNWSLCFWDKSTNTFCNPASVVILPFYVGVKKTKTRWDRRRHSPIIWGEVSFSSITMWRAPIGMSNIFSSPNKTNRQRGRALNSRQTSNSDLW